MKKSLFIISLVVISSVAHCQTKFENIMLSSIDSLYKSIGTIALPSMANTFERIAMADTTRWEPLYYAAYSYCMMSLHERDNDKKDELCNKSQSFLDKAFSIVPGEAELFVLQGFLYNMRLIVNPAERAMLYIVKINAAYDTAEKLDSLNPRVYYMRANMIMNMPPFMGGGKDKALPVFEKARQKFDTFTTLNILAPRWGKQDCNNKIAECSK